jgi:hypothetical protein
MSSKIDEVSLKVLNAAQDTNVEEKSAAESEAVEFRMLQQEGKTMKFFGKGRDQLTDTLIGKLIAILTVDVEKKEFDTPYALQAYVEQFQATLFEKLYLALFGKGFKKVLAVFENQVIGKGTFLDIASVFSIPCLLATNSAKAAIQTELYHAIQTKKILTDEDLTILVNKCCEQPAQDLFKHTDIQNFAEINEFERQGWEQRIIRTTFILTKDLETYFFEDLIELP